MTLLKRHLGTRLLEFLEQFPVVIVKGARQVGKTTFLRMELEGWTKVDLEDAGTASLVKSDPALFLRDHPERVWFDEAQRVPELFAALRVAVDADRRPGRFVLSGSSIHGLVAGASDSLAGRAGILELFTLSPSEQIGRAHV